MKPLLDAYAAQLTRTIDAARSSRQLTRSLCDTKSLQVSKDSHVKAVSIG